MKNVFVRLCVCFLLVAGFCFNAEAAPSGRDIHCLVLSNTGHFESMSPQPLRDIMEAFGGVNYTFKKNLSDLSVEEMQKYDVVWVYNFAEWGMSADMRYGEIKPEDLSNILGNYVEQGGALVECMYINNIATNTLGLNGGKYITGNYSPFKPTMYLISAPINMGTIEKPQHPIMKNIRAVSTDVTTYNRVELNPGAEVLAYWYETEAPIVAVKDKIVSLNMAPVHLNMVSPMLGVSTYIYGDAHRLIDNSIKYLFTQIYDLQAPDTVSMLSIVSVPDGTKFNLNVSWNNPTKTIEGENLTKIDSVVIFRDEARIAALKDNLQAGAATSYNDVNVPQGDHSYSIIVYGNGGKGGYPAKLSSYSGRDLPSAVSRLILQPDVNKAVITWNPTTTGKRGGYIDQASLKYKIIRLPDNKEVVKDITTNTYTDASISKLGEYSYKVIPYTVDGEGVANTSYPFMFYTNGDIWMRTSNITACGAKFYDMGGPDKDIYDNGEAYALIVRPQHPEKGEKVQVKFSKFGLVNANLIIFDGEGLDKSTIIEGSPFQAPKMLSQLEKVTASPKNTSGALTFYYVPEGKNVSGLGWEAEIGCITPKDTMIEVLAITGELLPAVSVPYEYTVTLMNSGLKAIEKTFVGLIAGTSKTVALKKEINQVLNPGDSLVVKFMYTPTQEGDLNLSGAAWVAKDTNISKPLTAKVQNKESYYLKLGWGDIQTMFGPICFFHRTSVTETMYYPYELNVAQGKINAIRYYNSFSKEMLNQPVKIWIAETDASAVYGFTYNKMTQVFDGIVSFPYGENEITIPLQNSYDYKGKNLLVRIERPYNANNELGTLAEAFNIYWDDINTRQAFYKSRDKAFVSPEQANADENTMLQSWIPWTSFVMNCEDAAHLSGTVKNASGQPIDSAKLTIKGTPFVYYTNKDGKYYFPALNAGKLEVVCEKFDYVNDTAETTTTLGNTAQCNFVLVSIPKSNVSGKVLDNAGELVKNAKIALDGYAHYEVLTKEDGSYTIEGVYSDKQFTLTASKDLFYTYSAAFTMGSKDTSLADIVISQWEVPALGVTATAGNDDDKAKIEWTSLSDLEFSRKVYDDGSSETGYGVVNGKHGWFGNFFGLKDSGYIHSIDLCGSRNNYIQEGSPSERNVTIDIFDGRRQLIHSSKPFKLPESGWITIDIPYIPYDGAFYAMVHFNDDPGYTHHIGCDLNGQYSNAEYNYYSDGMVWGVVQSFTMGVEPFCFLIRANVLEKTGSDVKSFSGSGLYDRKSPELAKTGSLNYDINDVIVSQKLGKSVSMASTETPSMLKHETKAYTAKYDVYRFLKADKTKPEKWTKVNTEAISISEYEDKTYGDVPQGVCGYAVQCLYGPELKSEYSYSNYVSKNMLSNATLSFVNNNESLTLEEINVEMTCLDSEDEYVYVGKTNEKGEITFNNIWKGSYKIHASKFRYIDVDTVIDFKTENNYIVKNIMIKEELRTAYNLKVEKQENGKDHLFSWNESVDIYDGWESHIDFTMDSKGKNNWIYKDVNKVMSYAISGVEFPHQNESFAYIVFNPAKTTPPIATAAAAPFKGKKYLSSFSSSLAPNDKWLISPRLHYENTFVLSFAAKTFDAVGGLERFQVGYSANGTEVEDFKWIQGGKYASAGINWGEFDYDIPAEAKHVAIRCVSNDQYMFMLDEVSIGNEKEGSTSNIIGYKVYLDGKFVAETQDKNYTFSNVDDVSKHTAGIVVKYASGESVMEEITFGGTPNYEPESLSKVNIYPNPATDVLYLDNTDQVSKIEVLSLSGAILGSYSVQANQFRLPVASYTSGIYVIKLVGNDGVAIKKFVKK